MALQSQEACGASILLGKLLVATLPEGLKVEVVGGLEHAFLTLW